MATIPPAGFVWSERGRFTPPGRMPVTTEHTECLCGWRRADHGPKLACPMRDNTPDQEKAS